jgi:hypothetical protein
VEGLGRTPIDEETGISLSVFVTPEDFINDKSHQHHKEHPDSREELQDYAGRALRYSATQELPRRLHMGAYEGAYHYLFWGPKEIPTEPIDKIRKALLQLGGVIPRQAIVLNGKDYELHSLTDEEHSFLSDRSMSHIEGKNLRTRQFRQIRIGQAIVKASLDQDLADIASRKVKEQFIHTGDMRRQKELGNFLIQNAISELISSVLPAYEDARRQGMVDPKKLGLRSIVRNFIPYNEFNNYYEILRNKISYPDKAQINDLDTKENKLELAA